MEVVTVSVGSGNVLMLFVLVQLAANRPRCYTLAVNYDCTMLGVGTKVAAWFAVVSA